MNFDKNLNSEKIKQTIELLAFKKISTHDKILSDKILDSVSIVELALNLENIYQIKISPLELTPHNFDNLEDIVNFVNKKIEQRTN